MSKARSLQWAPPSDDTFDEDPSNRYADGIGGRYRADPPKPISPELLPYVSEEHLITIDGVPHFKAILWWAHDEFSFDEFDSLEAAQQAAEIDWQQRFAALVFA